MQNKFIVIEGTDGSGKKTQFEMLCNFLRENNNPYETLDFPQYYDNFWGKMVGRFLNGEFGELKDINPYLIQTWYMLDQASRKDDIKKWLSEGKFVVSNRYMTSSLGHQPAKFDNEEDQNKMREWIVEAGYNELGIAKEDVVILLYVDPEVSQKLAKQAQTDKKYIKGRDIAEEDFEHQRKSAQMFRIAAEKFDNWHLVECINENGEMRSREEIHEEIKKILGLN